MWARWQKNGNESEKKWVRREKKKMKKKNETKNEKRETNRNIYGIQLFMKISENKFY